MSKKNIIIMILLMFALICSSILSMCSLVLKNRVYLFILFALSVVFSILLLISFIIKKDKMFRILCILSCYYIAFFIGFFVLNRVGLIDDFSNIDKLQSFILKTKNAGIFVYFAIALLQVLIIPVPAIITVLAGSILFGPLTAFVICTIGILLGSIIAFWLGRVIGQRFVRWVDKNNVSSKYLDVLNQKGGIILFFMFLLPLFPDDMLCVIAGISNMKVKDFVLVSFLARTIGIAFISFFGSGSIFKSNWIKIMFFVAMAITGLLIMVFAGRQKKKIEG